MKPIIICKAQPTDITTVVDIHMKCFKNSFSSSLGKTILCAYYNSYLKHNPDLFLIAKCDGVISGFVVGYRCENKDSFIEFKKKNRLKIIFRTILRLFLFDKRVYKKIFKKTDKEIVLIPSYNSIPKNEKGDLLSICVLSEYRNRGIATDLEKEFNQTLLHLSRKYCILSCLQNNLVANRFYEKLGYILYKKNKVNNYYIKEIK